MADWPQNRNDFLEWFWERRNGNNLIKELNDKKTGNYIRREKDRPTIYCLVLNDDEKFPPKEGGVQWKLCKVGFTCVSTAEGAHNRMKKVRNNIIQKYTEKTENKKVEVSVVFVLSIGAVDTTPYFKTEKRLRELVGKPVNKEEAKKMKLYCSTEWALTTQDHIDRIQAAKEKATEEGACTTDIFKNIKLKLPQLPDEIRHMVTSSTS